MVCSDFMICKNMYVKSRAIIRFHDANLKKINLTYTQSLVLLALNEGEDCFVEKVAKKLDLDTGTITPLVKKLVAKGLIEKVRSQKDERKVALTLTDKGRAIIFDIINILQTAVEKLNLSTEEQKTFLELLKKINI